MFWRKSAPRTRIFFATDIHGSEQCFRKWLNAARVYEADVLILGGDVTGKMLVPLTADPEGVWHGSIYDDQVEAHGEMELVALQKKIRTMGRYDVLLTPEEKEHVDSDERALDALFHQAIADSLRRWMVLAAERLDGTGVPAFMMLGNDDFPELVEILRGAKAITHAEDGIQELPGGFELLSLGYSTPTPWHTPRELPEADIQRALEKMTKQLNRPEQSVFNVHCPPARTHLDQAPQLDDNLKPVVDASGVQIGSVGSESVRRVIETTGPLLGLHGHVHESPGTQKIGRALCINPGSDYADGILRGAIVDLDREKGIQRWQVVQG